MSESPAECWKVHLPINECNWTINRFNEAWKCRTSIRIRAKNSLTTWYVHPGSSTILIPRSPHLATPTRSFFQKPCSTIQSNNSKQHKLIPENQKASAGPLDSWPGTLDTLLQQKWKFRAQARKIRSTACHEIVQLTGTRADSKSKGLFSFIDCNIKLVAEPN